MRKTRAFGARLLLAAIVAAGVWAGSAGVAEAQQGGTIVAFGTLAFPEYPGAEARFLLVAREAEPGMARGLLRVEAQGLPALHFGDLVRIHGGIDNVDFFPETGNWIAGGTATVETTTIAFPGLFVHMFFPAAMPGVVHLNVGYMVGEEPAPVNYIGFLTSGWIIKIPNP